MGDVKRYQLRQYYEDASMEPVGCKWGHLVGDTVYVTEADHLAALSSAPQGWREVATMLLQARYGAHWQNIIEVHGADHYAVKLAQRLSSPAAPATKEDK